MRLKVFAGIFVILVPFGLCLADTTSSPSLTKSALQSALQAVLGSREDPVWLVQLNNNRRIKSSSAAAAVRIVLRPYRLPGNFCEAVALLVRSPNPMLQETEPQVHNTYSVIVTTYAAKVGHNKRCISLNFASNYFGINTVMLSSELSRYWNLLPEVLGDWSRKSKSNRCPLKVNGLRSIKQYPVGDPKVVNFVVWSKDCGIGRLFSVELEKGDVPLKYSSVPMVEESFPR